MEKSLYGYILRHSLRQQVILTLLSVASFLPYYYYLAMPKAIVNEGIIGKHVHFPITVWGYSFSHAGYLVVLTLGFLALVLIQQAFKYVINVYQGISGERMLRRLRYELYARVLRFPLPTFKRMSSGEIIPMITAETETLGGFIANAFAVPLFQGGMFMVSLSFLFLQNWRIAVAALALYPFQLYVIPKMQRRVNDLGKERVRAARRLADRIGESISGVQEVHTHHASNRLLAEFSDKLGEIYWVRYDIFQRKFMIKFLNNFLQQLGPFLFYLIGGYLAIQGRLDVGTVIAAVAAQKEMGAPLKELLNYYQQQQDARIKYEQVAAQFDPPGMRGADYQAEPEKIEPLSGDLQVSNLSLYDDFGGAVLEGVSFTVPSDKHIAIVGGTGRDELAMLLARLLDPSKGRITIGGVDLATMSEAVIGRRMAYVGQAPFIFSATIEANLFYGLRHLPTVERSYEGEAAKLYYQRLKESEASGNSVYDTAADWTDYAVLGVSDTAELHRAGLDALRQVGMFDDVFQLGLRGRIQPEEEPELVQQVLQARLALREKLAQPDGTQLVEGWDPKLFNDNATVAENLMFGSPVGDGFAVDELARHPYMLKVLDTVGLTDTFLLTGFDVATTMVELFADLPPDHEFFSQFSFISSDELPEIQELLGRSSRDRLGELKEADRTQLMSLPFKLIAARHRLGVIDPAFIAKILEARTVFARDLPADLAGQVEFFDPARYTAAANLQDNILFGKLVFGQAKAAEKLGAIMGDVIEALGLRDRVAEVGLNFQCGIAGSRLAAVQRQKLAIARCVVKRPDILVISNATALLDAANQTHIMDNLLQAFGGRGLIWSLHRPALANRFDHVLVLENGRLTEQGVYGDLEKQSERFKELLVHD